MGKIADQLIDLLKSAQDLRIITIVGKVTVQHAFDQNQKTVINITNDQKAIVTSISLVEGDIINGIDPEYALGEENSLRDFHEKQVKLGNDIINRNLMLLKDLSKEIIDMIKQESGT